MKTKKILIGVCIALALIMVAGALFAKFFLFKTYEYEQVRVNIPATCADKAEMDTILVGSLGKDFGGKEGERLRVCDSGYGQVLPERQPRHISFGRGCRKEGRRVLQTVA